MRTTLRYVSGVLLFERNSLKYSKVRGEEQSKRLFPNKFPKAPDRTKSSTDSPFSFHPNLINFPRQNIKISISFGDFFKLIFFSIHSLIIFEEIDWDSRRRCADFHEDDWSCCNLKVYDQKLRQDLSGVATYFVTITRLSCIQIEEIATATPSTASSKWVNGRAELGRGLVGRGPG